MKPPINQLGSLFRTSAPVLCACLILTACGKEEPPAEAPVARPVKMVSIGTGGAGGTREYPGQVSAIQHAEMAFEVPGRITEFPLKEGQTVSKGTLLARLDPRDYQAAKDAATAQRNATKADYERYRDLYERDAASRQELDVARRHYEVAEAELATARKALEDTMLKAPFDGKLARKLIDDPPVNVQAKEPVLILQDDSSLKLVINIPEGDWALAAPGLTPEERAARAKPMVVISTLPDRRFPATIKEFATTADAVTRTFETTFAFDKPADANIMPGMTAKVIITLSTEAGRATAIHTLIPANAVLSDDQGNAYVWRVEPSTMQVQKAAVKSGELSGSEIQILDGLADGDTIAISGVHNLREGMLVRKLEQ